jgi:hypothetical protein
MQGKLQTCMPAKLFSLAEEGKGSNF